MPRFNTEQDFWNKVAFGHPSECWEWTGCRHTQNYGRFSCDGEAWYTHRLAYTLVHGAIPDGGVVRHKCDNPPCCNPGHLLLGTQADNITDMMSKGRANKAKGEESGLSKLSKQDVFFIRSNYPEIQQSELARMFGVNQNTVSHIVNGKTWQHLLVPIEV